VDALPGSSKVEHFLANLSHAGLYAFMTIMPATGIAMGYYGGKGLPFFWTTLPGVVKTDENKKSTGAIAGQVCGITGVKILLFIYWLFYLFAVNCFLCLSFSTYHWFDWSVPPCL
jgi:cytochrome b561